MQEIRGRSWLPLERLTCQLHQEEAKIKGQGEPSLLVTLLGKGLWPGPPRSHPMEWNPVHYFYRCQGQGQVLEIKPKPKCSSLGTSFAVQWLKTHPSIAGGKGLRNSDPTNCLTRPEKKKHMIKTAFYTGGGKDQLPYKEYLENCLTTGEKGKKCFLSPTFKKKTR